EMTLGQAISTNITPAGIIAAFGVPVPMAGAATGIFSTLGGLPVLTLTSATVNMGNTLSFQFGSTLTVGSGYKLEAHNSPATWKLTPGTGIMALLYAGINLADALVPAILPVNYKNTMSNIAVTAGTMGALELILNIWTIFETYYAGIATAKHAAAEAATAAAIKTLQGDADYAKTSISDLATDIVLLAGVTAAEASAITKVCDSIYTIDTPQIVLRSNPAVASVSPSQIKLSALGNAAATGEVTIEAKTKTHVNGGAAAYLNLESIAPTNGTIVLDCGALGKLSLQSGLTQQPNAILLEPDNGITIASLLKVMLDVLGNSILIDPDGIALVAGDSSITMTAEGIILNCGGNGIQITPEGVTITGTTVGVNATTLDLVGTSLDITGSTVTVVGPEINIG
ncbi:MAG TPA: hypothetical protein VN688_18315, partial [Gemmataceae bacterium]|nr:hypothetical protein [Gemmataceae bacterium]